MRILMVCLGNICRSPLAEGIMKTKAAESGLNWEVDSAGTGYWHSGEPPDRRSIQIARKNGIDITDQRARQFRAADFEKFDKIFVMDVNNRKDVLVQAKDETQRQKVVLMLDLLFPGQDRSVPDPYYDDNGFEEVFGMLDAACTKFVEAALSPK
ncbi:MAG: low molecular weight phosphotyrosine protein phosphatase [Saprospiraceae bacterium]|nr:low molecular weight phosphotyrosine protein phosphatase [Saprospiraceae bacterium]